MSFQKIDQKEINKLKNLYNTKLKELKSENQILKIQLEDKIETLKINQDLLLSTIENMNRINNIENKNNNIIKNLKEKSKIILEKLSLLIEAKAEKGKKIDILQKEMPLIQEKIVEKINIINNQSEIKNKEIFSEDTIIKKLKLDLDKIRRNAFFKKARTEILVAPPSKSSLEINSELICAKDVFSKASKLHQEKKKKSDDLWREEKNLKDEMNKLKNNIIKEKNINKDEQNFFLEEIGYNILPENYEKEEEEESEESEQSSDDDNNGENNGDKKKKEKEIKNLNEQYNKLEKKIEDYEKKINEYKKIYRKLKNKIGNFRQDGKKK